MALLACDLYARTPPGWQQPGGVGERANVGWEEARRMLAAALKAEVNTYLAQLGDQRDEHARRPVVSNGYHGERTVATAAGPVPVRCRGSTLAKLTEDEQELLALYAYPGAFDPPADYESHRLGILDRAAAHKVIRGAGSRGAALAMTFKLIGSARDRRHCVNTPILVALVRAGTRFECGVLVELDAMVAA